MKRNRVELAVKKAKKNWDQIFDAVPDQIAIIDRNHRFQRVNRAMAKQLGTTPGNLIGRTCYEVVHGLSSPADSCPMSVMLEDGQEHTAEFFEKNMDGYFSVTVSPLHDDKGHLIAGVHVANVNAKKKAEQGTHQLNHTLEVKFAGRANELLMKANELEETNSALRVLLRQREKDRLEIEESVLLNVRVSLLPYLEKLKDSGQMSPEQLGYIKTIENNLGHIISPFVRTLSDRGTGLSPAEIRVAEMIRAGKSNKEIAGSLLISVGTVRSHRERLRKKLGLTNQKTNLCVFIQSLPSENT